MELSAGIKAFCILIEIVVIYGYVCYEIGQNVLKIWAFYYM